MLSAQNPILVEVLRGGVVESQHRGAMLAVNAQGETVYSVGDISQLIFPRSSLKLLQVLPLIEQGGVDAFKLSPKEVALACASHNGEAMHVNAVEQWLGRLDLQPEDLECGPAMPINEATKLDLVRAGGDASRVHNNCSGKHTGMLTLAKLLGSPTKGYSSYEHPVQQAWLKRISVLSGINMQDMKWDRDGCGMPAPQMPLDAFAKCWAYFAAPESQEPNTAAAMKAVLAAIGAHPEMIAGKERCCTAVIQATKGEVIVKTGAEAVFGGVIPKMGMGFALKIDDGATRASDVALGGLLAKLDALTEEQAQVLSPYFNTELKNTQGYTTGEVRAVS